MGYRSTLGLIKDYKIDVMWMNGKWHAFYNRMHCESDELEDAVSDVINKFLEANYNE